MSITPTARDDGPRPISAIQLQRQLEQLQSLLRQLADEGFQLSVSQQVLAHQVCLQLYDQGILDDFSVLGPILCTNQEQQRKFDSVEKKRKSSPATDKPQVPGKGGDDEGKDDPPEDRPKDPNRKWLFQVSLAILLTVSVLYLLPYLLPTTPTGIASSTATPGNLPTTTPAPNPLTNQQFTTDISFDTPAPILSPWHFVVVGLTFLIWGLKTRVEEVRTGKDPTSEELAPHGKAVRVESVVSPQRLYRERKLFNPKELRTVANRLRRLKQPAWLSLDPALTVSATIQRAGFPDLRYKWQHKPQVVLLLIERQSLFDHLARLVHCYFEQLQLPIEIYFFRDSPWDGIQGSGTSLLTILTRELQADQVWVVGELDAFSGYLPGHPADWLEQYRRQPWTTTVLTVQATRERPKIVRKLQSEGVRLLPFDNDGISKLGTWGPSEHLTFLPWIPALSPYWSSSEEPDSDEIARGLREVRDYLDGSTILETCAFLPELRFALTLELIEEQHRNLFYLVRLFRLPWFRQGGMPIWVREALLTPLDPTFSANRRHQIFECLKKFTPNTWPRQVVGHERNWQLTTVPMRVKVKALAVESFRQELRVSDAEPHPFGFPDLLLSLVWGTTCGLWARHWPLVGTSGMAIYLVLLSVSRPNAFTGLALAIASILPHLYLVGYPWQWIWVVFFPLIVRIAYRIASLEAAAELAATYKDDEETLVNYLDKSWHGALRSFWLNQYFTGIRQRIFASALWPKALAVEFDDTSGVPRLPTIDRISAVSRSWLEPFGPALTQTVLEWSTIFALPLYGLLLTGTLSLSQASLSQATFLIPIAVILVLSLVAVSIWIRSDLGAESIFNKNLSWKHRIYLAAIYTAASAQNINYAIVYLAICIPAVQLEPIVRAQKTTLGKLRLLTPPVELVGFALLIIPAAWLSPGVAVLMLPLWMTLVWIRDVCRSYWNVTAQFIRMGLGAALLVLAMVSLPKPSTNVQIEGARTLLSDIDPPKVVNTSTPSPTHTPTATETPGTQQEGYWVYLGVVNNSGQIVRDKQQIDIDSLPSYEQVVTATSNLQFRANPEPKAALRLRFPKGQTFTCIRTKFYALVSGGKAAWGLVPYDIFQRLLLTEASTQLTDSETVRPKISNYTGISFRAKQDMNIPFLSFVYHQVTGRDPGWGRQEAWIGNVVVWAKANGCWSPWQDPLQNPPTSPATPVQPRVIPGDLVVFADLRYDPATQPNYVYSYVGIVDAVNWENQSVVVIKPNPSEAGISRSTRDLRQKADPSDPTKPFVAGFIHLPPP